MPGADTEIAADILPASGFRDRGKDRQPSCEHSKETLCYKTRPVRYEERADTARGGIAPQCQGIIPTLENATSPIIVYQGVPGTRQPYNAGGKTRGSHGCWGDGEMNIKLWRFGVGL